MTNSVLSNDPSSPPKRNWYKSSILAILKDATQPMSSGVIAEKLRARGMDISDRTVRFYLHDMDSEGLTRKLRKHGRQITNHGQCEWEAACINERIGQVTARIDQMACRMSFDVANRTGTVVLDVTLVKTESLGKCLEATCAVSAAGSGLADRGLVITPGECVGRTTVPKGLIGIGTVSSASIKGICLKHAIPATARFGGLLEIREKQPFRFTEIIHYDSTSINPLEVFCRSGMTDYHGVITTGNGRIGASYWEFPLASRGVIEELSRYIASLGLGGINRIGYSGQILCGVPADEGRLGALVTDGIPPAALAAEYGFPAELHIMSGLVEFSDLAPFSTLRKRSGTPGDHTGKNRITTGNPHSHGLDIGVHRHPIFHSP